SIYAMDAETQNAVDMAALAGASALTYGDSSAARQRASDFLAANCQSTTHSATTTVIDIGRWTEATKTFAINDPKPNAVRITATRHDAPLYFAAVFGASRYNMTRAATAIFNRPIPCSIWGLQGVSIGGGSVTNSYDSTAGAYSAGLATSEGNVCSCKNVSMN